MHFKELCADAAHAIYEMSSSLDMLKIKTFQDFLKPVMDLLSRAARMHSREKRDAAVFGGDIVGPLAGLVISVSSWLEDNQERYPVEVLELVREDVRRVFKFLEQAHWAKEAAKKRKPPMDVVDLIGDDKGPPSVSSMAAGTSTSMKQSLLATAVAADSKNNPECGVAGTATGAAGKEPSASIKNSLVGGVVGTAGAANMGPPATVKMEAKPSTSVNLSALNKRPSPDQGTQGHSAQIPNKKPRGAPPPAPGRPQLHASPKPSTSRQDTQQMADAAAENLASLTEADGEKPAHQCREDAKEIWGAFNTAKSEIEEEL